MCYVLTVYMRIGYLTVSRNLKIALNPGLGVYMYFAFNRFFENVNRLQSSVRALRDHYDEIIPKGKNTNWPLAYGLGLSSLLVVGPDALGGRVEFSERCE